MKVALPGCFHRARVPDRQLAGYLRGRIFKPSEVAGAHVHIPFECQSKHVQRGKMQMLRNFRDGHVAVFQKTSRSGDLLLHQVILNSGAHFLLKNMRDVAFAVGERLGNLFYTCYVDMLSVNILKDPKNRII